MAKKNNKRAKKKDKSMMIHVKFTLLWAALFFYLIAIFSNKTGLVGEVIRNLTLGIFGFSGYLLPLTFFLLFSLRIIPSMAKNRSRFSAGIVTTFIMTTFIQGYIFLGPILDIFSKNISTFKTSYETGLKGESAGVFGNLLVVLTYKATGSYGILILAVALGLLSFYFFTRFSIADFQKSMPRARDKKSKKAPRKKEKPLKQKKTSPSVEDSYLFGSTRQPEGFSSEPGQEEATKKDFNFTSDYDHVHIKISDEQGDEPVFEKPFQEEKPPLSQPIESLDIDIKSPKTTRTTYKRPPLKLLENAKRTFRDGGQEKQHARELARRLEEILLDFSLKASVLEVVKGPIVNRFELQLEPGTKISKLTGLADDIALNMAVPQVRVAPIPGRSTIGIEIPNNEKDSVALKEILSSREYKAIDSKLAVALGKDISGKSVVADLADMPHLLIAGSTGSGKSVCINTIIASLLINASPDEVKLLMIDPKVVELSNYNGIPHLILPVVTDPKKAAMALGWAVNEMTRRYEIFAEAKVKDIAGYNRKIEDSLPRIVVIIDELADLMMVAPAQVEDSIARLSQMARAAGIHLIVATQRPSTEVITGQIKTNIPSRISFAVSSAIDSRIILDMSGAEKLLGKGDMLYSPFGTNRPKRVQGCFVSDVEINNLVEFIKNQGLEIEYKEEIVEKAPQSEETLYDDEYLEDAIKLVIEMKSASASMLQRRFRIGYNRAGRLIDMMDDMGIIGPPQASKPRDVLVSDFEEVEPWN